MQCIGCDSRLVRAAVGLHVLQCAVADWDGRVGSARAVQCRPADAPCCHASSRTPCRQAGISAAGHGGLLWPMDDRWPIHAPCCRAFPSAPMQTSRRSRSRTWWGGTQPAPTSAMQTWPSSARCASDNVRFLVSCFSSSADMAIQHKVRTPFCVPCAMPLLVLRPFVCLGSG